MMTPAFLFLLSLSLSAVSQSAPADQQFQTEKSTNVSEIIPRPRAGTKTPVLHDDIAVQSSLYRNAHPCTDRGCKWPRSGHYVYIPYYIDSAFTDKERDIVTKGLTSFNGSTCIRFITWEKHHRDYVHFFTKADSGCWSSVGRQRGGQYISLESGKCVRLRTVQHEILHALGFKHEQARSDRDRYVQILYGNIKPEKVNNFRKDKTNNLGTLYDFNSVMHYKKYTFSANGKPTIVAKANPGLDFGHARQMSANDIARVNKLYKCKLGFMKMSSP